MELVEGQSLDQRSSPGRPAARTRARARHRARRRARRGAREGRGAPRPQARERHADPATDGSRCSTSGSPSSRRRIRTPELTQARDGRLADLTAPAIGRRERCRTWRRSRSAARPWTRVPTCSRSGSCSTSWRRAAAVHGATHGGRQLGDPARRAQAAFECARGPAAGPRAHHRRRVSRRTRESASRPRSTCRTSCGGCARSSEPERRPAPAIGPASEKDAPRSPCCRS